MRVLWMIDSLGPGGAESLMPPLLKVLKEQVDEPRVCVLWVRAGNPIALELEKIGIPVDLIPVSNLRDLTNLGRVIKYIRQYRPDVIHTQLETSDILGSLAARLLGIPSVATLHTLDVQSRKFRKHWRNSLLWACLKFLTRRVIVVSGATRQHYVSLGFKNSHLVTIYNGIETSSFAKDETCHPTKMDMFGLPEASVVLTTVAVLREQKGIQHMLYALPELVSQVPGLYYVVVGDGDHRESLENLSRSLGVADRVLFMGYRTDIADILAATDLFVYPSLKDALPTVLLEAMAAGVPIVSSLIGGVPEILENEVSGLLVPPAEPASLAQASLCLLQDQALANRLTDAARQVVRQRFDIHQQASSLLNLYTELGSN